MQGFAPIWCGPNADKFLSYRLKDDGGVKNGGIDTSTAQKVRIQLQPVNDKPSGLLGCGDVMHCSASCSMLAGDTQTNWYLDLSTTAPSGCECIGKEKTLELRRKTSSGHSVALFGEDYGTYCAAWEDGVCSSGELSTGPLHSCGSLATCEQLRAADNLGVDQSCCDAWCYVNETTCTQQLQTKYNITVHESNLFSGLYYSYGACQDDFSSPENVEYARGSPISKSYATYTMETCPYNPLHVVVDPKEITRHMPVSVCNITLSIRQDNLGECFKFEVDEIATIVSPTRFDSVDEYIQDVSFVLSPTHVAQSDNALEDFLFTRRPTITTLLNSSKAHMSMCVSQHRAGNITYQVSIIDENGAAFRAGFINLQVLPSNRPPYFELCDACADWVLGMVAECCQGNIIVREGSGHVQLAGFTANISAGRIWSLEGLVHEAQDVSFVVTLQGQLDIFASSGTPSVAANGTLSLRLRDGHSGKVQASVVMIDDGDTRRGGVNQSSSIDFIVYVVSSAIGMEIAVSGYELDLSNPTAHDVLRALIHKHVDAALPTIRLSIEKDDSSTTSSRSSSSSTGISSTTFMRSSSSRTTTAKVSTSSFVGRSADVTTMPAPAPATSEQREPRTYVVSIELLSWSTPYSMDKMRRMPQVFDALQHLYSSSDIDLIKSPYIRKISAVPSYFDVNSSHVVLLETSVEQTHVLHSFFSNISQSDSVFTQCKASVSCVGSCACVPSTDTEFGHISDGPGDYAPDSHCTWVISTGSEGRTYPCADILLYFQHFDTEAKYDTVKIFSCASQDCLSRTEIASLDGNQDSCRSDDQWVDSIGRKCSTYDASPDSCDSALQFAVNGISAQDMCCTCGGGGSNVLVNQTFISSTGHMQIVFTSDQVVVASGFDASWETSNNGGVELINLEAINSIPAIRMPVVVPSCTPLCLSADLALVTLPFLFGSGLINFSLGIDDNFTQPIEISIQPVNDAPQFDLVSIVLQMNETTNSTTDWASLAVNISKGPSLRSGVTNEDHQTLAFHLRLLEAFCVVHAPDCVSDQGWLDVHGRNCEDYVGHPEWCMESDARMLNGSFAAEVCCACGGSSCRFNDCRLQPCSLEGWSLNETWFDNSGGLYYRAPAFFTGRLSFMLTVSDDGGTDNGGISSFSQSVWVNVLPINQAPSFALLNSSIRVMEAGSSHVGVRPRVAVVPLATRIEKGPRRPYPGLDEESQTLTFVLTALDEALERLVLNASWLDANTGYLHLDLNPYQIGDVWFDVKLLDSAQIPGERLASADASFLLTIESMNDPPKFELARAPPVFRVVEFQETVASSSRVWVDVATNISSGPPFDASVTNEAYQNITFRVTPLNSTWSQALFRDDPIIHPNGTLELVLRPYRNGRLKFSVVLTDSGGEEASCELAACSSASSLPQTLILDVLPINNEPRFDLAQTVFEAFECKLHTRRLVFHQAATNITKGPPFAMDAGVLDAGSEDFQNVHFVIDPVSHDDDAAGAALFETVHMHPNGTLELILKPYTNGIAAFRVTLLDDGGVQRGGRNASATAYFSVHVLAVNDPPFFEVLPIVNVTEVTDLKLMELPEFASLISKGPPIEGGPLPEAWIIDNEEYQNVSFSLLAMDETRRQAMLQAPPAVTADGSLLLWLTPYENGELNVSIWLSDDGPGANVSATRWFVIRVLAVNNAPFFELEPVIQVLETAATTRHVEQLTINGSISKGPPIPRGSPANATVSHLRLLLSGQNVLDQPQELLHLQSIIADELDLSMHHVVVSLQQDADQASRAVVSMSLVLGMSMESFDSQQKLIFVSGIANAADVHWTQVRMSVGEELEAPVRRRLLAVKLKIRLEILLSNDSLATKIIARLTMENVVAALRDAGLGSQVEIQMGDGPRLSGALNESPSKWTGAADMLCAEDSYDQACSR